MHVIIYLIQAVSANTPDFPVGMRRPQIFIDLERPPVNSRLDVEFVYVSRAVADEDEVVAEGEADAGGLRLAVLSESLVLQLEVAHFLVAERPRGHRSRISVDAGNIVPVAVSRSRGSEI